MFLIIIVLIQRIRCGYVSDSVGTNLFCQKPLWFEKIFSETDIIKKYFNFVWQNKIFVKYGIGGHVFQQTASIPIGINCAPLLDNLFLYLHESNFMQYPLKKKLKECKSGLLISCSAIYM
jgi:hypothetical protein